MKTLYARLALLGLLMLTPVTGTAQNGNGMVIKVATTQSTGLIKSTPTNTCKSPVICWQMGTGQKPLSPITALPAYRKYMRYINQKGFVAIKKMGVYTTGKVVTYPSKRPGSKIEIDIKYRTLAVLKKGSEILVFLYSTDTCPVATKRKHDETACVYIATPYKK